MRRIITVLGLAAAGTAFIAWWRNHRRFGTEFMNRTFNPALLDHRFSGRGRSEIGTLEHVGRRSGLRRLTPVHPVATTDGFRIVVPLGPESQWAQNVLAAGHCRVQLHDTVYELDEPKLVTPDEVEGLPQLVQRLEGYLGFRYLTLHTFASARSELAPAAEALVLEPAAPAAPAKPRRRRPRAQAEPEPELAATAG